jgi:tetratricopeptide (TPR) repeat protein
MIDKPPTPPVSSGLPDQAAAKYGTFGLVLRLVASALAIVAVWLWAAVYNLVPASVAAFLGLVAIYPLTYVAYLGLGADAQRKRLQDDFRLLGLAREEELEETVEKLYRTVYSPLQFVVFVSLVVLASLLIFWAYLRCTGPSAACSAGLEAQTVKLVFYSYLGAFVFSVQELVRRYDTFDLQPQVYSGIAVRILIATAVTFVAASVILSGGQPAAGASQEHVWPEVVAFAIGIFPTQAIRWLTQQAGRILGPANAGKTELPLTNLLGISAWHEARLAQMGIDDAQNLATVDIRRLLLTTQFDTQEIVHWIDQAILYARVGDKIPRFRDARISSYHEFYLALSQVSLATPVPLTGQALEQRLEARKRLAVALGMTDADELDRLGDSSNFPNYSHIAEYYARTARVAHERANLGMEIVLGAIDESDYQRAAEDLERLLRQYPDDARLWNTLGYACYRLQRLDEALAAYDKAIALDGRLVEAYYNRSLVYVDRGDYERAVRDCTDAIGIDRGHAKAFNNRGLAYMKLGYFDRALEDFDEALRLDERLDAAYLNRGVTYSALNRFDAAVQDFERTSLLGNRVGELWLSWGKALIGVGRYREAIDKLSQAVLYDTNVADAYAQRGYAYLQLEQYPQARLDLGAAIARQPDLFAAHHNLGLLEARLHNDEDAVRHYQKALEIDERQYLTRYNLAVAYLRLGKAEEARQELQRVIELAPADSPEAREARLQLASSQSPAAPTTQPQDAPGEHEHDETAGTARRGRQGPEDRVRRRQDQVR